jgi:hypothetical protein
MPIPRMPEHIPKGMPITAINKDSKNTEFINCFLVAPTLDRRPNCFLLSLTEIEKEL